MNSLECELCEQRFITNQALKTHNRLIHLSVMSKCDICQKEYKDLHHHKKYIHENVRNYDCPHCEIKFRAKKLLNDHIQGVHFGLKAKCPDCGKNVSLSNLTRHVNETHKKIRSHVLSVARSLECQC